jgi:hypothetical protein
MISFPVFLPSLLVGIYNRAASLGFFLNEARGNVKKQGSKRDG